MTPQTVGNCGLYLVCYKLSCLGLNVMPTSRNARAIDIVAYSGDCDSYFGIQVKSLSRRSAVPLGKSLDKVGGTYWVVVVGVTNSPVCYVMTADEVRTMATRDRGPGGAYWLEPKTYEQPLFREAWGRLTGGSVSEEMDG